MAYVEIPLKNEPMLESFLKAYILSGPEIDEIPFDELIFTPENKYSGTK